MDSDSEPDKKDLEKRTQELDELMKDPVKNADNIERAKQIIFCLDRRIKWLEKRTEH